MEVIGADGVHVGRVDRVEGDRIKLTIADSGDGHHTPRTVLEELARIQSHDVLLPTATLGQIHLRCVAQPDAAQAALLDRLGIVLPKRMRPAEHERPALARSA